MATSGSLIPVLVLTFSVAISSLGLSLYSFRRAGFEVFGCEAPRMKRVIVVHESGNHLSVADVVVCKPPEAIKG